MVSQPFIVTLNFLVISTFFMSRSAPFNVRLSWLGCRNISISFATVPILVIAILRASQNLGATQIRDGIVGTNGVNPCNILILFKSLAYMDITTHDSDILDASVFWVGNIWGSDPQKLYRYFHAMFLVLIVFLPSVLQLCSKDSYTSATKFQPSSRKQIDSSVAVILYPITFLHLLFTFNLKIDDFVDNETLILATCFLYLIISTTSHAARDALSVFDDSIAPDVSRRGIDTIIVVLLALPIAAPLNLLTSRLYEVNYTTLLCLNALPFILGSMVQRGRHLRQLTVLDWKDIVRPVARAPVLLVTQIPNRLRRAPIAVRFGTASILISLLLRVFDPFMGVDAWKVTLLLSSGHVVVESASDYYHYAIGRPGQWARLNGQYYDSDS